MEAINLKDIVKVNYQTKWYNLKDVPGIVLKATPGQRWPYKIRLQDKDGKPINLGHDDENGGVGSGPYIYCKEENLTLVEKYVPKKLEGAVKSVWKIGDRFMVKPNFSLLQAEDDEHTGVIEDMLQCQGKELTVAAIIPRFNLEWLFDGQDNWVWKKEWIDAVE